MRNTGMTIELDADKGGANTGVFEFHNAAEVKLRRVENSKWELKVDGATICIESTTCIIAMLVGLATCVQTFDE